VLSQSNVRRVKAGVSIEELAEDIARRTLLQSLDGLAVLDAEGAFTFLNDAASHLLGADLGSAGPFPRTPGEGSVRWAPPEGPIRELDYRVAASGTGHVVWFRDVTDVRHQQERLTAIARVAAGVTESASLPQTLEAVAREIVATATIAAVQILAIDDPAADLRILGMAGFGAAPDFVERFAQCRRLGADVRFLDAFAAGRRVVVPHRKAVIMADPLWAPLHEIMDRPDCDGFVAVPMTVRGRTLGVVNAYFVPGEEPGPLAFLLSKNLHRRHLNESQRAMVGARLATLQHGGDRRSDQAANLPLENSAASVPPISQATAADTVNVSERLVRAAKVVQQQATPELKRAVNEGRLAVSAAAQAAHLPEETQQRIAQEAEAGRANVVRTIIKKERRDAREVELSERQRALPEKKYGVIVADPEWRFEPYSRETGMDRAPENHYPTSDTLDIIARPVASIADRDAVLFLWATAPMLPQAFAVMRGWGFEYKTHAIWHKVRPGAGRGSGYWFTGEHELLLVGSRGSIPAPATALCGSVIAKPIGGHSAKPDEFLELIELAFPNLPKIELNRRGPPRAGWDAWGNEAEQPAPPAIAAAVSVIEDMSPPAPPKDDGLDIPAFLRRDIEPSRWEAAE